MRKLTEEFSPLIKMEIEYLIKSGLYNNKGEVIQDALKSLMVSHPHYKIEIAIEAYLQGEVSLGRAAHLSGLSYEEMKDILRQRGIEMKLGPSNKNEAQNEVKALEELFSESNYK